MLVSIGGVVGFLKGKSKPSLVAGLVSGAALIASYSVSLRNPTTGFLLGAIICVILVIVFAARLVKTKKFMPSGMLLALSVVEGIVLLVGRGSQ